jgi:hypothetical protein
MSYKNSFDTFILRGYYLMIKTLDTIMCILCKGVQMIGVLLFVVLIMPFGILAWLIGMCQHAIKK